MKYMYSSSIYVVIKPGVFEISQTKNGGDRGDGYFGQLVVAHGEVT